MNIWKLSMGTSQFGDYALKKMIENNVVSVHHDTPAKGQSSKSQGENFLEAKQGDLFFLCRSNESIELIGMFKDNNSSKTIDDNHANSDWVDRKFILIKEAVHSTNYNKALDKWWHPSNYSTFIEVKDLTLFESEILFSLP